MSIKISYEDAYKILDIIQKAIGDKTIKKINELKEDTNIKNDESMNDM